MFNLFDILTSKITLVQSIFVEERNRTDGINRTSYRNPLWIRAEQRRTEGHSDANMTIREQLLVRRMRERGHARRICTDKMVYSVGGLNVYYYLGPWQAYGVNKAALPFKIYQTGRGRVTVMAEPRGKRGLPEVTRGSTRIKEFHLGKALMYSYLRDLRFVLVVCAMIGVTAWWALTPEPLLLKPHALCANDLGVIVNIVKETFVNKVCNLHQVSSPCECGEPVNRVARQLFEQPPDFDPLETKRTQRTMAAAVLIAGVILSIAMAESVSQEGVRWDK